MYSGGVAERGRGEKKVQKANSSREKSAHASDAALSTPHEGLVAHATRPYF